MRSSAEYQHQEIEMIVAIDKKCCKCNKNEPVHHTISEWSDIKPLLVVDTNWACRNCGCKAAYWYFYREPVLENLKTVAEIKAAQDQVSWQLFGFTEDAALNIKQSPNFEIGIKDPADWTKAL
jgi:hypothetical protein